MYGKKMSKKELFLIDEEPKCNRNLKLEIFIFELLQIITIKEKL